MARRGSSRAEVWHPPSGNNPRRLVVLKEIYREPPPMTEPRRNEGIDPMDIVRIILAVLLPPLGVFLQVGFGGHFWLNILLTILGYIPGIVHAVWIIARR
jgi:uncharacterized membrane protein YqaE (UPF0057 family)